MRSLPIVTCCPSTHYHRSRLCMLITLLSWFLKCLNRVATQMYSFVIYIGGRRKRINRGTLESCGSMEGRSSPVGGAGMAPGATISLRLEKAIDVGRKMKFRV